MKRNLWQTFLAEIKHTADRNEGLLFRKAIIKRLRRKLRPEQIDNYRLHLERAGYIRTFGAGKYTVVRFIPYDLGWRECMRMAYPKRFKRKRSRPIDIFGTSVVDLWVDEC